MPKSVRGFTLIELLVVVAIMGVLGVATINYGNFSEVRKLAIATSDIQSLLKLTQANAAARVYCSSDGGGNGAKWWLEFATDKKNVNLICDNNTSTIASQTVKTYSFDPSIEISSISGGSPSCIASFPANAVKVNFEPLYATVTFTDAGATPANCSTSQYLTVILKNTKTSDTGANTKVVKIDRGGSISVQ